MDTNSSNASTSSSATPADDKLGATAGPMPAQKRNSISLTGGLQIPASLYDSDDYNDDDDIDDVAVDDDKRPYQGGFAAAAYNASRADHLQQMAKQSTNKTKKKTLEISK